ncbi:hypothetical protein THAOC_04908 [Thalassiosira oceanica]|uniref:Uncharacterized protein n=1 Tax=Thalassiosira oceanica TaxID=159749 RepID=K0TI43_THAOC|nr:hypothetical protein THAOC_04908 [Thalassiosira oceanica]|eukprot:EJK73466.1 hypothetical protein THAOC_04908 [Thalassiosira oceanica]
MEAIIFISWPSTSVSDDFDESNPTPSVRPHSDWWSETSKLLGMLRSFSRSSSSSMLSLKQLAASSCARCPQVSGSTLTSSFHTSGVVQRPGGKKEERNPKISINLEQLRMAARGMGRRAPICHEQHERVMNSLEAAKYEYIMEVSQPLFSAEREEKVSLNELPVRQVPRRAREDEEKGRK